ncbi:hypothetical protein G9A89_016335 [Geosiphon pyriformis]|nr:hypothetical protein G9A89_016335 [Geosiphon pyriformis]
MPMRQHYSLECYQMQLWQQNLSLAPSMIRVELPYFLLIIQQAASNKGKRRLQTLVVTPKQIQLPTWKKTRVKSPTNPLYYYISGSAINILLTDTSTSHVTSTFG